MVHFYVLLMRNWWNNISWGESMIDCSFFGCTWYGFKMAQVQEFFFWLMGLLMNNLDTFFSNQMTKMLKTCDMDLDKENYIHICIWTLNLKLSSKSILNFFKMLNRPMYLWIFFQWISSKLFVKHVLKSWFNAYQTLGKFSVIFFWQINDPVTFMN
jgi:hypothetical protein